MIYFNSDYLEGAHPYVMEKLNETNMVQTARTNTARRHGRG